MGIKFNGHGTVVWYYKTTLGTKIVKNYNHLPEIPKVS